MSAPTLRLPVETQRLVIRELAEKDLEPLYAWRRNPAYRRHLPMPRQTRTAVEAELGTVLRDQTDYRRLRYLLGVIERKSGRMLGEAILKLGPALRHRQAEIGWAVAEDAKGHGYATEIGGALLDAAFGQLRLHRVFAMCSTENGASRHVMEKLGMREEGLLREHFRARERWWSSHIYAMLDSEHRKRKGRSA